MITNIFYFLEHAQKRYRLENKIYSFITAFTLAEVLIVLGIIGLIADMTIPTLHQKIDEKVTVTKLQKAYSTLESAFRLAVIENDTPDNWGLSHDTAEGAMNIADKITPYLNVVNNCGVKTDCLPNLKYSSLNGVYETSLNFSNSAVIAKAQLNDGSIYYFYSSYPNCTNVNNACASVYVDINGYKKPNRRAVDLFEFYIQKDRIVPTGIPSGDKTYFKNNCGPAKSGISCTAWVIYKGNMDYMREVVEWD